ncbi:MAG TPA: phosphocholine cytidylyltransferase family protein [Bryobacteraceae bacterium]|nr:phosphocholine cytidylyltransferase family protein [Bryobacteraceae bacterium]
MKALILAAGQGTRIRSAHGNRPKCLIQCNDSAWTILDQQIDSLFSAGVRDIGIAVGYEKDQIIRHVTRHYRHQLARFRFIENPAFAETNNIYSLWLAREWLKDSSFVCLNADVVCDSRILNPAVRSNAPVTMIVDREWRDETMKVIIDGNRVIRMSKQISQSEFSATYIGITAFDASVHGSLFDRIDDLVRAGNQNVFFNVAVQQLADEGLAISYTETSGLPWAEIDDPGDLAFAKQYVFPKLFAADAAA